MAYCLINPRYVLFRQIILPINGLFKSQMTLLAEDVKRGSIIFKSNNPFDLFNEWFKEAEKIMTKPMAHSFILSNYSPERKVRSRLMMFAEQKEDYFHMFGSSDTDKMKDIIKNPHIAMCFVWTYMKDHYFVIRQVRARGEAKQLSKDKVTQIFDKLNLPLKIEWVLSKQNNVVEDWKQNQEKYARMTTELKTIAMPSYMTGFTITVKEIEFLHNITKTTPFFLADRVLFTKEGSKWSHKHIGA